MKLATQTQRLRRHRWWRRLAVGALLAATGGFAQTPPEPAGDPSRAEEESRQRLIRKTRGADEDDVMVQILRRMGDAGQRLADLLDPGAETQDIQQQILDDLDLAIKQARQNLRMKNSSAPSKSDPRDEGEAADTREGDTREAGSTAAGGQPAAGDDVEAIKPGALHERQRQWGNLPPRDRQELLQSADEEFNDKYQEQIERYYEALAEPQGEGVEP